MAAIGGVSLVMLLSLSQSWEREIIAFRCCFLDLPHE